MAQLTDRTHFRLWMAAVLLSINVAAIAIVFVGLKQLYDHNIKEAEIRSQNLVLAIDLNLSNEISKLDLSLKTVIAELGHHLTKQGKIEHTVIQSLVKQQKELLSETESWSIANADGQIDFHDSATGTPHFSIADRDYFRDLKSGKRDGLLITKPLVSRLTRNHVVILVRAFRDQRGQFAGVVAATLPMEYFSQLLSGFEVGPRGILTLRDADLGVITRFPATTNGIPTIIGDTRITPALAKLVANGSKQATYHALTIVDHVERIYSYRVLSNAPIYAHVGIATQDVLADWKQLSWRVLGFLGFFLLITNISAALLYRQWRKQQHDAFLLRSSNDLLEASLQQIQERDNALVSAQEAGELGTYSMDIARGTWTSSEKLNAIFGIDAAYPHDLDGWLQLLHEDDRASMSAYLTEEVIGRHQVFDREYRIVRPGEGEVVWAHGLGKLEFNAEGEPVRMSGTIQNIAKLKESQRKLEYMAYYDELTALPNRSLLTDRMRQAIARCRRKGNELLGVCYLDLDGFKSVNDQWGHEVGDKLLVEVAKRLQSCTRANDTAARLGGDEFVVLFCDLEEARDVENAASRLIHATAEPYRIGNIPATLTISVGVTIYPNDAMDEPDALIRHADQAMYEAKRNGKNRMHFFDTESDRRLRQHQQQYARLVEALAEEELRLFYQPKVDLRTGAVVSVEALLRWQHPEQGLLQPYQFLPEIEETELTLPVGEWILHEALQQIQQWHSQGIDLQVSANIFALHLQRTDFVERLEIILQAYPDVDPSQLELEILETTAMENLEEITERIRKCKHLGVRFSLDDFGTGYSSLTYLRQLPVDVVKIDRSFVRDLLISDGDMALIQGIVGMAHTLKLRVVAEGVETLEHGIPLLRCGCDLAQGYGIARPMQPDLLPAWLAQWRMPEHWKEILSEEVIYFSRSFASEPR